MPYKLSTLYQPYASTCIGQLLPDISEDLIIKFGTHCSQNLNLKWSSIKLYVSGLRFHYIKAGINSPFSNMDRLRYIMSAIRRKQGYAASSSRYPITFPILYSMCSLLTGVCSHHIRIYNVIMCHAVSLFSAFFAVVNLQCFHNRIKINVVEYKISGSTLITRDLFFI